MVSMPKKRILTLSITLLTALFAVFVFANEMHAGEVSTEPAAGKFGIIKGVVRDRSGEPISEATVAIFRVGTSELLKQVTATKTGRFFAKIVPGTYTVLAVAQGFNPVTLKNVEIDRATELNYGFKLERAGNGNTLPEKRVDRKSPRTAIRAARRSIYQIKEDEKPLTEGVLDNSEMIAENDTDELAGKNENSRKGQTVVETFAASNDRGSYAGVNFATLKPISEKTEIIFAGQLGIGRNAPKRFETSLNFRPGKSNHQIQLKGSVASLGEVRIDRQSETLGQISLQALDQWRVREGVIFVFGVDYSRFIGAGDDYSISPRIGFQYDLDSRTRINSSYTAQTEERTWQKVIELEGTQVLFREPVAVEDIAFEDGKPQLNKSTRLELGIERVLDNRSTIEGNVFFDTVAGSGVGLTNLPFDTLSQDGFSDFISTQRGKTQGVRVVYNRRLNSIFSTSTGYAFGNGQKLSGDVITNPAHIFENGVFHTAFGEVNADLKTGTSIHTIFRFSPQATVFAVDPFKGRLAIYDPGLSVLITQELPSWGLPIDAEAIIDGRNLFDFQNSVGGEEGSLRLNSQRRILRGGILVRF